MQLFSRHYIITDAPNYSERKSKHLIRLTSQSPSAYAVCRCNRHNPFAAPACSENRFIRSSLIKSSAVPSPVSNLISASLRLPRSVCSFVITSHPSLPFKLIQRKGRGDSLNIRAVPFLKNSIIRSNHKFFK